MKTNKKISIAAFTAKMCVVITMALFLIPKEQKAQTFTTGITAGVSTASVKVSNIGNSFINTINGNNIMGFEGGLFERINLGPFFIKPMLLLGYQGGTASYYDAEGNFNNEKFDYGNIEVPLMFGLKILGPIRIEVGPVYNWIYTTQFNNDNSITVNPNGLGYRAGANIELGMVNLGVAYQGVTNKADNNTTTTFESPNELIFSLALCFGGGENK
jgi:hypothetical protein